jgi:hypothetical protein
MVGDGSARGGAAAHRLIPGHQVPVLGLLVVGAADQEREVQRRAGRVQVGHVSAHGLGVGGQRRADARVEFRHRGPQPGDLEGVHDHPGAERALGPHDLGVGADRVVAVLPPVLPVPGAEVRRRPGTLEGLDGRLLPGVGARRPGREAEQPHAPARVADRPEAELGVGLVVAADDRGPGFRAYGLAEPVGHRGEPRERERQPVPARGAGPAGQRGLGDHRERPLGSDQEPPQVRSGGRARHRQAPQDLAVRQDRGDSEQHILDRPEAGGRLPGRRRGDPAADGGKGDRLRVEAGRQPVFGQGGLELVAAHAGLDVDDLRHQVDVEDLVHSGQVQDDGTGLGLRSAADAGAAAAGDHRRGRLRRPGQDRGHLLRAGREDHRGGEGKLVAADAPQQRQRPGVDGVLAQRLRVGPHGAVGQAADQKFEGAHDADRNPRVGPGSAPGFCPGAAGRLRKRP